MSLRLDLKEQALELFCDILEADPAKRGGMLDQACKDNLKLRKQVETLLTNYPAAESFFDCMDKLGLRKEDFPEDDQ